MGTAVKITSVGGGGGSTTLQAIGFNAVAQAGTAFTQNLQAVGGTAPYTWTNPGGGLPPGLSLSSATVTGTPTQPGVYTFNIKVTDSASNTSTASCTITVTGFTIAAPPSSGVLGTPYVGVLQIYGGNAPFTFALTAGSLSGTGLTLSTASGLLNGLIGGTPTSVGVISGLQVTATDSTGKTAVSPTFSITITSAGSVVAVPEVTGLGVTAYYTNAGNGGPTADEAWNLIATVTGTPATSTGWSQSFLAACPIAALGAPGPSMGSSGIYVNYTNPTGTYAMGATNSSWAGGNINIYVTPWGVPSKINVDSTGYIISLASGSAGPTFNTALPTNLAYCLINGALNQIASYNVNTTQATLVNAVTPNQTGITFVPMEARYGLMNVGDSVVLDALSSSNETFTIVSISQVLNIGTGSWMSQWTLYRSPGAHPAHGGHTSPVAFGGALYSYLLIDVQPGDSDDWAGAIYPGKTQSVSSPYQMGAPTAYIVFCVGQNQAFAPNPWPVSTTPYAILGTVEIQTTGALQPHRLVPTPLANIIQANVGNSNNVAVDPFFTLQLNGQSAFWTLASGAYLAGYQGQGSLVLQANGANGDSPMIACTPGDQYKIQVTAYSSSSGANAVYGFQWFNSSGAALSPPTTTFSYPSSTFGITTYTSVVTVPSGAAFMVIVPGYLASGWTSGYYQIFQVVVTKLPAVVGALTINSIGETGVGGAAISTGYLAAAAVAAANVAAGAITGANDALSALAGLSVNSSNDVTIQATTIESSTGVIEGLIVGNLVVAVNLTTGGSIVSDQGPSYVGINALGHALVASNTSTGCTTVLDDGYVSATCSFINSTVTVEASGFFGGIQFGDGVYSFALELLAEGSNGVVAYQQGIVDNLGANLLLSFSAPSNPTTQIQLVCGVGGTYLQMSASGEPAAADGIMYYDGTHLWFCVGTTYHQIF